MKKSMDEIGLIWLRTTAVVILFWLCWNLIIGPVPVVEEILWKAGTSESPAVMLVLPFGLSRWLDVITIPSTVILIVIKVRLVLTYIEAYDEDRESLFVLAKGLLSGLVGVFYGLIYTLFGGLNYGLFDMVLDGLLCGLAFGLLAVLLACLTIGLRDGLLGGLAFGLSLVTTLSITQTMIWVFAYGSIAAIPTITMLVTGGISLIGIRYAALELWVLIQRIRTLMSDETETA